MKNFTKNLIFALLLLISGASLQAQSLSHSVIGSAGDFQTASNGQNLHWTIGEVAVSEYENDLSLWEGFHQMYYDLFLTPIWEVPLEIKLNVYPNPTAGWLRLDKETNEPLEVLVSNLLGQTMAKTTVTDLTTDFDLSPYPDGLYLLSVYQNHQLVSTFKINKQQ